MEVFELIMMMIHPDPDKRADITRIMQYAPVFDRVNMDNFVMQIQAGTWENWDRTRRKLVNTLVDQLIVQQEQPADDNAPCGDADARERFTARVRDFLLDSKMLQLEEMRADQLLVFDSNSQLATAQRLRPVASHLEKFKLINAGSAAVYLDCSDNLIIYYLYSGTRGDVIYCSAGCGKRQIQLVLGPGQDDRQVRHFEEESRFVQAVLLVQRLTKMALRPRHHQMALVLEHGRHGKVSVDCPQLAVRYVEQGHFGEAIWDGFTSFKFAITFTQEQGQDRVVGYGGCVSQCVQITICTDLLYQCAGQEQQLGEGN